MYGDGVDFHMDYYNSFVIHPMLTDVLVVMKKHNIEGADFLDTQLKRHARYAEITGTFYFSRRFLSGCRSFHLLPFRCFPCVRTSCFDAYFARTGETGAGALRFDFRHSSPVEVSGKFR